MVVDCAVWCVFVCCVRKRKKIGERVCEFEGEIKALKGFENRHGSFKVLEFIFMLG